MDQQVTGVQLSHALATPSVVENNEHHPAPLGRFVIVAPSINVKTYLLTYLLSSKLVGNFYISCVELSLCRLDRNGERVGV